ncbi:MAG: DNA repair protein RadC [Oscillospiraceae bacterium]|nr:DNA repair protein RadC [Oscillospiraceae bacterium]
MSIHEGHRQRLKDRFRAEGLDHFDQRHVLELLLFYCVPRQDTAPLAQRLLDHFGSVAQVLEAPLEELEKIPGVGPNVSTLIALTNELGRYYLVNRTANTTVLTTINECGDYLMHRFRGRRNETVFLLCLDAKCKVLSCREVGEGSVNSANVPIRRIVEMAMGVNATSVILAHNHPSGVAVPSDEDVLTTIRLAKALKTVEIYLADHIIVSDDDFVSMYQSGRYCPQEIQVL